MMAHGGLPSSSNDSMKGQVQLVIASLQKSVPHRFSFLSENFVDEEILDNFIIESVSENEETWLQADFSGIVSAGAENIETWLSKESPKPNFILSNTGDNNNHVSGIGKHPSPYLTFVRQKRPNFDTSTLTLGSNILDSNVTGDGISNLDNESDSSMASSLLLDSHVAHLDKTGVLNFDDQTESESLQNCLNQTYMWGVSSSEPVKVENQTMSKKQIFEPVRKALTPTIMGRSYTKLPCQQVRYDSPPTVNSISDSLEDLNFNPKKICDKQSEFDSRTYRKSAVKNRENLINFERNGSPFTPINNGSMPTSTPLVFNKSLNPDQGVFKSPLHFDSSTFSRSQLKNRKTVPFSGLQIKNSAIFQCESPGVFETFTIAKQNNGVFNIDPEYLENSLDYITNVQTPSFTNFDVDTTQESPFNISNNLNSTVIIDHKPVGSVENGLAVTKSSTMLRNDSHSTRRDPVDISNDSYDINNSPIDINNSPLANNSTRDIYSCAGVNNSSTDINNETIDMKNGIIDSGLHDNNVTQIDLNQAYDNNQNIASASCPPTASSETLNTTFRVEAKQSYIQKMPKLINRLSVSHDDGLEQIQSPIQNSRRSFSDHKPAIPRGPLKNSKLSLPVRRNLYSSNTNITQQIESEEPNVNLSQAYSRMMSNSKENLKVNLKSGLRRPMSVFERQSEVKYYNLTDKKNVLNSTFCKSATNLSASYIVEKNNSAEDVSRRGSADSSSSSSLLSSSSYKCISGSNGAIESNQVNDFVEFKKGREQMMSPPKSTSTPKSNATGSIPSLNASTKIIRSSSQEEQLNFQPFTSQSACNNPSLIESAPSTNLVDDNSTQNQLIMSETIGPIKPPPKFSSESTFIRPPRTSGLRMPSVRQPSVSRLPTPASTTGIPRFATRLPTFRTRVPAPFRK